MSAQPYSRADRNRIARREQPRMTWGLQCWPTVRHVFAAEDLFDGIFDGIARSVDAKPSARWSDADLASLAPICTRCGLDLRDCTHPGGMRPCIEPASAATLEEP